MPKQGTTGCNAVGELLLSSRHYRTFGRGVAITVKIKAPRSCAHIFDLVREENSPHGADCLIAKVDGPG